MFDNSVWESDTMEVDIRVGVLPSTIRVSHRLVCSRGGEHAISTVCQTSCLSWYGHVAE